MKEIGGYFEMELPPSKRCFIHSESVMVNSARHALEYILRALSGRVERLWVPYYTCNVVIDTIVKHGLIYKFYHIGADFELTEYPVLDKKDYIIVNNYFGIKDEYIDRMATKYGSKLIVDSAHAWYASEILGVNSFYSPRKFFGLPDGGVAFATGELHEPLEVDSSIDRSSHLLKRIDLNAQIGYSDFRENSVKLGREPLKLMSPLTKRILSSIDFEWAKIQRRNNFDILDRALGKNNRLNMPDKNTFACPMVYPYLVDDGATLKKKLIENKIFVATYWPNVLDSCTSKTIEYNLAKNLLPLPIDQRYGEDEMRRIVEVIAQWK